MGPAGRKRLANATTSSRLDGAPGPVCRLQSLTDVEAGRVLAATNRDLDALLRERTFREDLLYRLRAIAIVTPSLRERSGDVEMLAAFYLERIARIELNRCAVGSEGRISANRRPSASLD